MKKILIVFMALLVVLFALRPAEAGVGHGGAFLLGLGLGVLLAPSFVYSAPPVYYAPAHPAYPPAGYYRYYDARPPLPSRVWVRGYWGPRWNPYARCWQKTWVPGYWKRY
jgi:hypothetical protein